MKQKSAVVANENLLQKQAVRRIDVHKELCILGNHRLTIREQRLTLHPTRIAGAISTSVNLHFQILHILPK